MRQNVRPRSLGARTGADWFSSWYFSSSIPRALKTLCFDKSRTTMLGFALKGRVVYELRDDDAENIRLSSMDTHAYVQ